MENIQNRKSDVKAKQAFCNELLNNRGFQSANIVAAPADIKAIKDGITWYFEIKMTKRHDTYFGAATATEWEQAYEKPDTFRFVVVVTNEEETTFDFIEFTPEEFEKACTIPPFKIYFNIDLSTHSASKTNHRKGTVTLEPKTFARLNNAYKECKSEK